MADPATVPPAEVPRPQHVPNPRGNPNLHLSPRCGARTRAGGACQAPALHGRLRCRMHGGGSTGPRTEAGMARLRAARTIHGRCSATQRAWDRHILMTLRRARLLAEVAHWVDHMPPALAARMVEAPELLSPRTPTHGITPQQDKAIRQQEKAVQAPWWQAVAAARAAARVVRAWNGKGPHAPVERPALAASGLPVSPAARRRSKHGGSGPGAREKKEAHAPVTAVRPAEGLRQHGIGPYAPVGGTLARLQAAWLAAAPAAPASSGMAVAASEQTELHAPVGSGGRVASVHAEQGEARAPVAGGGTAQAVGALRIECPVARVGASGPSFPRPSAPDGDEEAEEPHAPVGLTRKQRKRWKWLRRQAAKGR